MQEPGSLWGDACGQVGQCSGNSVLPGQGLSPAPAPSPLGWASEGALGHLCPNRRQRGRQLCRVLGTGLEVERQRPAARWWEHLASNTKEAGRALAVSGRQGADLVTGLLRAPVTALSPTCGAALPSTKPLLQVPSDLRILLRVLGPWISLYRHGNAQKEFSVHVCVLE